MLETMEIPFSQCQLNEDTSWGGREPWPLKRLGAFAFSFIFIFWRHSKERHSKYELHDSTGMQVIKQPKSEGINQLFPCT